MSEQIAVSLAAATIHGTIEPVFTISGPGHSGTPSALLPHGFAHGGAAPVFTITGPATEARMRALEQRCEELQSQIALLARS